MSKIDYKAEAHNRPCKVMIDGVCVSSQEDPDHRSTVAAHLDVPGLNVKAHDIHVAWACHACHSWLGTDWALKHVKDERDLLHLQGVIRTQIELIKEGKL